MHNIEQTSHVIRSLSGLANYHGLVVGVSDEYRGLFVRGPGGDKFHDFSNFPKGISYKDQKKIKPDHESISLISQENKDYLLAFPSLSKPTRDEMSCFHISKAEDQLQIHSESILKLPGLFLALQGQNEVNIEGHLFDQSYIYLLNRGNEKAASELIMIANKTLWFENILNKKIDTEFNYVPYRKPVDLGYYEDYPIHWTEGIWQQDGIIVFLATVEKTDNAYDDGEVLASFIGQFDVKAHKLVNIKKFIDGKKAEGICLWNSRYLVAIDSDSPEIANEFYSLPLNVLK